jgi:BTB/POZ domain
MPTDLIVLIGGAERKIPISSLAARSEVFRDLIRIDDELGETIELEADEGFRSELYALFLEYLDTGEARIDGENVFSLLVLADAYVVTELKSSCIGFIGDNIHVDNVVDILNGAIEWNLNDLKWQCSAFAYENSEDENLLALLENEALSDEARKILEYGIQCRHLKPPKSPLEDN